MRPFPHLAILASLASVVIVAAGVLSAAGQPVPGAPRGPGRSDEPGPFRQPGPQAREDVLFDMAPLTRLVRPMTNPLQDRLPLVAWNLPLRQGAAMAVARATGELRESIDLLAQRGIVPTVDRAWDWTPEG